MILKFHGEVKNYHFIPDDRTAFKNAFIEHESKRVTVSVGRQRKTRSTPENRYAHGVVFKLLSEASGYDVQEIKGIVKYRFGIKKTSELNTVQFEEFMNNCRWWGVASIEDGGSGLDCYIPLPNEAEGE